MMPPVKLWFSGDARENITPESNANDHKEMSPFNLVFKTTVQKLSQHSMSATL